MRIVWIIDNKFRELYGLYDLRKKLLEHKIKLYFFHIPVWKTAIDLVNPNIVVVPNLAKSSCAPIVNYASKKKINILMHSSEGLFYADKVQKDKYPIYLVKKINKILAWSKLDAKFLVKKGFKKKVIISGNLKFSKKNFVKIKKKSRKIKVIGIPTHSRIISGTGISKQNIPLRIRQYMENDEAERIGYLKFEIEYIQTLLKIFKEINKNFQIVIKVSPFEDKKIYEETFPEFKIYKGENMRDFLKDIDLVLNVFSSTTIDALKYNIPVISITKLINWDETVRKDKNRGPLGKNGPGTLSIQPKNMTELKKYLKKNKEELLNICKKKNFFKKADSLAYSGDTLKILTNLFLNYQRKVSPKFFNYFFLFKYIAVTIRQILFRRKRRRQLYNFWDAQDRKLLKSFKL